MKKHSCQIYRLRCSHIMLVIPFDTGGLHPNHEESASACGGEDGILFLVWMI